MIYINQQELRKSERREAINNIIFGMFLVMTIGFVVMTALYAV